MKHFLAFLLIASTSIILSINVLRAQQSQKEAFMNKEYFDTTCSPCKDFYQFANGGWLKTVVIPPDRNMVSSGDVVREHNQKIIREILDSLAYAPQRHAKNSDERKLGVAYCNCMDSTVEGSASLKYLQQELSGVSKINSLEGLAAEIGHQQTLGILSLFWFVVIQDDFDPSTMIAEIRDFWAWRLPDQKYYLKTDTFSIKTRKEYVAMLNSVFLRLGDKHVVAEQNAKRVLDVETALAEAQPDTGPPVDNKVTISELERLAPSFKWASFLKAIGRPDVGSINIRPASLLGKIDSLVAHIPLDSWKAYLRWQLVGSTFQFLQGDPFNGVIEKFFLPLWGFQQKPPLYNRCLNTVNINFADVIGRAYVERSFSPRAKRNATELAESIVGALRETLSSLEWLTAATRTKALVKLDSLKMQIGFPDQWKGEQLSELDIPKEPFIGTTLRVRQFGRSRELSKIGKPAEVAWFDQPTVAGAWYYPTANAFSLTAAYLQPPFFDPDGSDIANYAAVGVTIGHELSHGFDDGGRKYNEIGRLKEWWTEEERKEFNRRAELVVKQYGDFIIVDSVHQNGRSTLSENISDIGGLRLAYLAFKKTTIGQSQELIDGYTPEQWFFIAFAQSTFRRADRPEQLPRYANSDHSYHKFRVNGPLSNLSEFGAAFHCKEGDPMVRPVSEIGQIWK